MRRCGENTGAGGRELSPVDAGNERRKERPRTLQGQKMTVLSILSLQWLTDIAFAALAILVSILAIYLAIRLLGKLAKLAVILVVIVLAIWLIFSEKSFLHEYIGFLSCLSAITL